MRINLLSTSVLKVSNCVRILKRFSKVVVVVLLKAGGICLSSSVKRRVASSGLSKRFFKRSFSSSWLFCTPAYPCTHFLASLSRKDITQVSFCTLGMFRFESVYGRKAVQKAGHFAKFPEYFGVVLSIDGLLVRGAGGLVCCVGSVSPSSSFIYSFRFIFVCLIFASNTINAPVASDCACAARRTVLCWCSVNICSTLWSLKAVCM